MYLRKKLLKDCMFLACILLASSNSAMACHISDLPGVANAAMKAENNGNGMPA